MNRFFIALCAAGLFSSPAFAGIVPDSWSTGAPPDPQWEETSQAVLSQDLVVIADDQQASAQSMLRKKAIVALTPVQAAKYTGPSVPAGMPAVSAPPVTPATPDAAAPAASPGTASPASDANSASAANTAPDANGASAQATPAAPADAQAPSAPVAAAPASPAPPPLKAYLVRGILLPGAIGGFTAERKGDVLWISYDGLAATAPKPLHRALVVRLPSAPKRVYVTASFTN